MNKYCYGFISATLIAGGINYYTFQHINRQLCTITLDIHELLRTINDLNSSGIQFNSFMNAGASLQCSD